MSQKAIAGYLIGLGMAEKTAASLSQLLLVVCILLLCAVGSAAAKRLVIWLTVYLSKSSRHSWESILLRRGVFRRFSHLVTPVVLTVFADSFPGYQRWIERAATVYLTVVVLFILDAVLNALDDVYRTYEVSKSKPIKGLLQAVKIFALIIGGIIMVAAFLNQSPLILLGGIGALAAVLSFVFKDAIMGFIAGIQLTANDMIRIGDIIEVPAYSASGTVTELLLSTVRVENFDHTTTNIPAYSLISGSFTNWRTMYDSGGRRIMRSICIHTGSISFCSEALLDELQRVEYLKEYLPQKRREIAQYNDTKGFDMNQPINGRRLTNIGVFRVYIQNYLTHHPGINPDMLLMVRQLPIQGRGLPLEIYAFCKDTSWAAYEMVQADIFDHLLAVAPRFGLRIFQEAAGYDLQRAMEAREDGPALS